MPKKTPPPSAAEATSALDTLHADRAALHARHAEITADRDAAAAALADAQADLIDGKADAAERVTTAQARVNGSDGALAMLAERIDRLDVQIEDAERVASLEAHRATLRTSAEAAEDARRRYYATIDTARLALTTAARQADAVTVEWRDASAAFVSALQACAASGEEQDAVLATLKEAGIADGAALSDRFHHVLTGQRTGRLPNRYSPAPDLGTGGDHAHQAVTSMQDVLARAERMEAHRQRDDAPQLA